MTVTKVVTVVKTKKGPHTHKKKGELMENDQDAMEVSFSLFFCAVDMQEIPPARLLSSLGFL